MVKAVYDGMNPNKLFFFGGNRRKSIPIECNNKIIDIIKQSKNVRNKNSNAKEVQEDDPKCNLNSRITSG